MNKDGLENIQNITFGPHIESQVKDMIDAAHIENAVVSDENHSQGYNHYYGEHLCKLNWAGKERPHSNKLRTANYSQDLNALMQEVIDDLTNQEVLKLPEELNITVQSVCPAFLKRKNRAKDKPKELLTKDDVRLLINYGPINDKIKDVPTPMTTMDDIFNTLGRWKHIIVFDLYNGSTENSAGQRPFLLLPDCLPHQLRKSCRFKARSHNTH